ncbi:MAG TPA: protein kinase [Steroidobacteraceae bacterium]|nr:protein kinase [Steroidobacteraceae bacterium]
MRGKKMFDPTQTQPLSWRMHQGKPTPSEDVPVEPPNRQAPTFDDSPPDRLSERGYRMRARLGGGRLGPIYEAQDELSRISGSQHFVAIQLIEGRIASRPGFAADFDRGAAELKSITHPNIVRLLEYGEDRNRHYLVYELLESASLRFVLGDTGALPVTEATAVLRAVGDALQYLHAKGIVHGNLRPENVLVTFGYEVKLLDVVPNGWLVNPNDALGVPARAPDKRDDVFGLACLGYEMLTGRHPFNGNTAQEAYRAGLEAERIDGVAEREWRALAGALSVHRDDRTPSVQQFLDEFGVGSSQRLKTVVAAPSAPPPPTYVAPEPPPAVARPVFAERAARERPERRGILGTAIVVLLVIGLAAAAWYYREPLTVFSSDLMAEVETRMSAERASADRAAPQPPAAGSPEAPLASAPEVTDPEPAMVLAPGASAPATGAAQAPEIEAPAVADAGAPGAAAAPAVVEPTPRPEEQAPAAAAPAPPVPMPSAPAAGPARFAFVQGSATVREGDVAARITIRRTGNLSGTASVSWWTAGGTAVADADYADLGARIEQFAPGEASRTVYVPLTNDAVREPVKSFEVLLGRGEGADGADAMRVEIVDDD